MDFKDMVAADVDNVFFNNSEFSEEVIIDGRTVPIILDNDALSGMSDIYAQGLADGEQFIFIKQKDLHRLPQPNDRMTKDGEDYYVRHAVSDQGIFALRIGRGIANEY